MRTIKIVLTGGPCGGKTETLEGIAKYFKKHPEYSFFAVQETATELINEGINPEIVKDVMEFQNIVLLRQRSKETSNILGTQIMPEKDICVIVYDRGILDNKAYVGSQEKFDTLLERNNLHEQELLDNYDLIIDLISLAGSEYGQYEVESNEARFEKEEDVAPLDKRTTDAWIGHENMVIITPMPLMEQKIDMAIAKIKDEISGVRKKPVQRFILNGEKSDFTSYTDDNSKTIEEERIYLDYGGDPSKDYIIKRRTYKGTSTYLMCAEQEQDGKIMTYDEHQISERETIDLIKTYDIKKVVKRKRLSFATNYVKYNVDFYDDMTTLEVETSEEDIFIPENLEVIGRLYENPEKIIMPKHPKTLM